MVRLCLCWGMRNAAVVVASRRRRRCILAGCCWLRCALTVDGAAVDSVLSHRPDDWVLLISLRRGSTASFVARAAHGTTRPRVDRDAEEAVSYAAGARGWGAVVPVYCGGFILAASARCHWSATR